MPHLDYSFDVDMAADGAMAQRHLIDLSKDLSGLYGRLIRQGQTFKVNRIQVALQQPDGGVLEVSNKAMAVAGDVYYLHPTGPRKKAWRNALTAVTRMRRLMGIVSQGYDFRLGLRGNSGWDTVDNQAWIRDETNPLVLGYHPDGQNSAFTVYNDRLMDASTPVDPDFNGFGTPFDLQGTTDPDFTANDATFYQQGAASVDMAGLRFQTSFSGGYDDAGSGGDWGAMTNAEVIDGPIWAMCGLLGIDIDTTYVDRSEGQTQNAILHVSVDVESWTPIVKGGKRGRRGRR